MPEPSPPTALPPEPEIELLARIAARALWLLRGVLWLAGAFAIGYGCRRTFGADPVSALGAVWIALGLPLVLPTGFVFGRGRWWLLAASGVLCFAPSALVDDHRYGFVLRGVATLVAALTLLVWRTLWQLTPAGSRSAVPDAPADAADG